jgi:hypothetical protein
VRNRSKTRIQGPQSCDALNAIQKHSLPGDRRLKWLIGTQIRVEYSRERRVKKVSKCLNKLRAGPEPRGFCSLGHLDLGQ